MDENDTEEAGIEEMFLDSEVPKVTKIESFYLCSSVAVEEAIFALDCIDHDSCALRDKDTNECCA